MVISRKAFFVKAGVLISILTIVVISIYAISANSFACEFKDKKLCNFLKNLDKNKIVNLTGSYREYFEGKEIMQVNWILNKDARVLKYYQQGQEELNLMIFKDYIYLKDYTDSKWWEQSTKDALLFSTKLPFEPSAFIANLGSQIKDSENSLTYVGQDICEKETCSVYNLKPSDSEKITKLFLSDPKGELRKVEIVDGETTQMILFQNKYQKIEKPSTDVKPANAKDNIFLSNFLERSRSKNDKPNYVEEFERTRNQLEESGDLSGAPEYKEPDLYLSPTPSI